MFRLPSANCIKFWFKYVIGIFLWQDETLLSDWKQQLDQDMETMKSQSNIASIRNVSALFWPAKGKNLLS